MFSNFWLLAVGSRDISQAEKEITACKVEQIHKLTTIFTQKDNLGPFWMKVVDILWICLAYQATISLSALSRDPTANSQNLEDM